MSLPPEVDQLLPAIGDASQKSLADIQHAQRHDRERAAIRATAQVAADTAEALDSGSYLVDSEGNLILPGGPTNTFEGTRSNVMVGGGTENSPNRITGSNELQTIVGGYNNQIDGSLASGIVSSMHGTIDTDSSHGTIVGGSQHTIEETHYSTVVGGTQNRTGEAGKPANYSTVAGGQGNTISAYWSGALSGQQNRIEGTHAVALGGQANETYGSHSVISGWLNRIASAASAARGRFSAIIGGLNNTIGQTQEATYSGIVGGRDHSIERRYGGILGGRGAAVRLEGAQAQAMGQFAAAGDAQAVRVVVRREVTATGWHALLIDGAAPLLLPANSAWMFQVRAIGRRTDGPVVGYTTRGVIKRDGTAGSTALVGTVTQEAWEGTTAQGFLVDADTSNGSLRIRGLSQSSGTTIRWAATVELTEVVV